MPRKRAPDGPTKHYNTLPQEMVKQEAFLHANPPKGLLKSGSKNIRQVQKLALSKKFTFFVQFSWNSVKMITSWGD